MNANVRNLWEKNKQKHLKKETKTQTVSETYPDGSYIWVSNYIKIINKDHVFFILKKTTKVLYKEKMDCDWEGKKQKKKL